MHGLPWPGPWTAVHVHQFASTRGAGVLLRVAEAAVRAASRGGGMISEQCAGSPTSALAHTCNVSTHFMPWLATPTPFVALPAHFVLMTSEIDVRTNLLCLVLRAMHGGVEWHHAILLPRAAAMICVVLHERAQLLLPKPSPPGKLCSACCTTLLPALPQVMSERRRRRRSGAARCRQLWSPTAACIERLPSC